MAWVYALRSQKNGKVYVGWTNFTPDQRLMKHHSGGSEWSKRNGPFDIVFREEFESEILARKREKFFKTGKGRMVLKSLIQNKIGASAFPATTARAGAPKT